jgi:hypothetical protein
MGCRRRFPLASPSAAANAAIEGHIDDLAVQPANGVLNAGIRPIELHHIVKVVRG